MNISTANGFFANYRGQAIKIKHVNGTDWMGIVTAVATPNEGTKQFPAPQAVTFMLIEDLEAYKKNKPAFKGKSETLWLAAIQEVHQLA